MENFEKNWYVVNTYASHENKVKDNIVRRIESMNMQDYIFRVIVAEYEEPVKKDGVLTGKFKTKNMYPGYIFIEMIMTDEAWYVVRNTRGVTGFVGPESKPRPLSDAEVISMGVETHTIEVNYNVGDYVTIIGGPFDNFKGYVDEIDVNNDFVRVIISMMGRDTPIELGLDQVEPALD